MLAMLAVLAAGTAHAGTTFDVHTLDPYEGYLVTRVDIAGNDVTKDFVVRREIRVRPGDVFHVSEASHDITRLENMSIFSSTTITAVAADSTVALTYTVKEIPWIIPYPRLKYTEQDGFSVGAGVASVNLFGRAIYLSGYGVVGGVDQYSFLFRYPWITGNHLNIDASMSNITRNDDLNEFKEHSRELVPWVGFWLGDSGRLAGTVSFFQMNSDRDGITLSGDRRDEFLRLGLRAGYDTRDSWRRPRTGWNNEFLFMWEDGGVFGRPGNWPLFEIDVRRYLPVGHRDMVSIGSLTSLQTGTVGVNFPGYLQYRMGGANSIRGYDIEKLGKELYGTRQWIVTTEYRHQIVPIHEYRFHQWSASLGLDVAAFADWGTAWSSTDEFAIERSRGGFGIGLRFLVPAVLEVRTDLAVGRGGDFQFHLGVGDKLASQRNRLR